MIKPLVHIFTDGACSPNPGIGGWAAILIAPQHDGRRREIAGAERDSTNNRMELTAAVMALRALKFPCKVELTTDSEYLKNAFTEGWLANWRANGWRTKSRKPVANDDLWKQLLQLSDVHEVQWHWVRGHADNELNARCDALAVQAREELANRGKQ
jgi:ribonuclease HI